MKREIMSTERYEQVLDMLETDPNAFKKLTLGEKVEVSRDGYAMSIAASTNVNNLRYVAKMLRQDKTFMAERIKENPLAMCYCYKTWFKNSSFVRFVKDVASADSKKYDSQEVAHLYDQLIDKLVLQTKTAGIEK